MNLYQLECSYCGHIWQIKHPPSKFTRCTICNDPNIKAKDLRSDIDYYAGAPKFEDPVEYKSLENKIDEPKDEDDEIFFPYIQGSWD